MRTAARSSTLTATGCWTSTSAQGAVGGTDTSYHSENGLFWGTPDGRLVGGPRDSQGGRAPLSGGAAGYNVAVADVDGDGLSRHHIV